MRTRLGPPRHGNAQMLLSAAQSDALWCHYDPETRVITMMVMMVVTPPPGCHQALVPTHMSQHIAMTDIPDFS